MNDNLILIIDIETTGFLNTGGKICEIGMVSLCKYSGMINVVYDKVINPFISDDELSKSWIVSNGYMTLEEINNGVKFEDIKDEIQEIINSYPSGSTAYNNIFDFGFLESYGISIPNKLFCPMRVATNICRIVGKNGNFKFPKAEEAYNHFFPDSNYIEKHRGLDDAYHEARIVSEILKIKREFDREGV